MGREVRMKAMGYLFVVAAAATLFHPLTASPQAAKNAASPSLSGQVTSQEEGAMEGVLVSAKKDGGTITLTVVSDEQGRYQFPAGRLDAGHYALRIRAGGYDLD